jgi:Family of unknown function (DUF5681)
MTAHAEKTAGKQRGRPFAKGESGNPAGKPKGARNRVTLACDALLEGEADAITRKAIEMAKAGDGPALRLCMDRIAPPRRDRHVPFALQKLEKAEDALRAAAAIVQAVAEGELTPGEATELSKLVENFTRVLEATDFQRRLAASETKTNQ